MRNSFAKWLNSANLYQQLDECWKKEINYFLSTGYKFGKEKHGAFRAFIYLPTITPSLSHSIYLILTLFIALSLSLIGQFSCYFLGNQTEFNCSISLALYLALDFAFTPHRSGLLISLLCSRQPNRFLTQIFDLSSLWSGIYSISPNFSILKTYLWSVCFFLNSNFVHSLLFAWKILNCCGFFFLNFEMLCQNWICGCVLRAFNVIASALGVQLNEWSRRVQISLFVG